MTPEERGVASSPPNAQPPRAIDPSTPATTPESDPESLQRQIRQTRSELGDTIDNIERRLEVDRLTARAEELADHVVREATERAKQVVLEATDHAKESAKEITDRVVREATERAKQVALEATDHAKESAKEITDHAIAEAKLAIREMTGQASEAAREATIGKVENMVQNASQRASGAGSSVVELIARNPMAAALAGIGLGWLFLGNRSSMGGMSASGRYYPRSGQYVGSQTGWTGGSPPVGEQLSSLGDKLGDKFGEAHSAARGALDQVQETAGEVAGQAQEKAQEVGYSAADAGSTLLETIQRNPLPTMVAAASLGYLFLNRPGAGTPPQVYEARYRAEHAVGQLRDSTGQITEEVQGTASEVAGRVQQTTGRMANQAQGALGDLGSSAQAQALRTQYRFEQFFSDHPLVVGGAALALGMLAGLPVPQTQQEHELMGQVSGQVIDRAQTVAQETAQKVQQAVEQKGPDDDLRRRAQEVAEEAEQLSQRLNKPA